MIKDHRLSYNKWGEPKLVIEVSGVDDIYRFTHMMTRGQCEFAEMGFSVQRRLKRKMGSKNWRALRRFYHGGRE